MKKTQTLSIVILLALISLIQINEQALAKNYLLLRGEATKNDSFKTYTVINPDFKTNWDFLLEATTVDSNYKALIPTLFYKINPFKLGVSFLTDSFGNKKIGPKLFHAGNIGPIFSYQSITRFFDLTGNNTGVTEGFLHVSLNLWKDLYLGNEFYPIKPDNKDLNLRWRYLKIGYRFKNDVYPFIMTQKYWNFENDTQENSFFGGIEIKW